MSIHSIRLKSSIKIEYSVKEVGEGKGLRRQSQREWTYSWLSIRSSWRKGTAVRMFEDLTFLPLNYMHLIICIHSINNTTTTTTTTLFVWSEKFKFIIWTTYGQTSNRVIWQWDWKLINCRVPERSWSNEEHDRQGRLAAHRRRRFRRRRRRNFHRRPVEGTHQVQGLSGRPRGAGGLARRSPKRHRRCRRTVSENLSPRSSNFPWDYASGAYRLTAGWRMKRPEKFQLLSSSGLMDLKSRRTSLSNTSQSR